MILYNAVHIFKTKNAEFALAEIAQAIIYSCFIFKIQKVQYLLIHWYI